MALQLKHMLHIKVHVNLADFIKQKIRSEGPISFRDFMELSLYYPGSGYYNSPGEKLGVRGDYYTSPFLTSIFGQIIGKQLEEMWVLLNKKPFTIVEYGAGTGILCEDILEYLKLNKMLYRDLRYCIIEKSQSMLEGQKKKLHEKVKWINSIDEISPVEGCILTNEVLDNFPVHQVIMEEELMEVFVDYQDEFIEKLIPANTELKEFFERSNIHLPQGHRAEVSLAAVDWMEEVAAALSKGFIITMDYGYTAMELCSERRKSGTLVCYHKHKVNDSPYSHIGEQDITAHVNFSSLRQYGSEKGLQYGGFTDQAAFLVGAGITESIRSIERQKEATHSQKAILIQKLLFDLGKKIKILLQYKGLEKPALSGFQFANMASC
jgi:SAM-dependent MidA family methyltransferase